MPAVATPPAQTDVQKQLLKALDDGSPIGHIPAGYPFFDELCRRAHIGFHLRTRSQVTRIPRPVSRAIGGKTVTVIEYEESTESWSWRDWFVAYDDKLQPAMRKTATGRVKYDFSRMHRTCTQHVKFRAILDYVCFRAEMYCADHGIRHGLSATNVFDVVLGKAEGLRLADDSLLDLHAKIELLWKQNWREVINSCAEEALPGYDRQSVTDEPKQPAEEAEAQTAAARQKKLPF